MKDANTPLLTVIIPVYNRAELMKRTLASVEAQSLRPLNLILVDNNSTDNTLAELERWKSEHETPGLRVTVLRETSPGAAAARNRGLREVTTPYTMFFDSDDVMAPNHCRRAVDGFLTHPDAEIVGWDVRCVLQNKQIIRKFATRNAIWNNIQFGSMSTQRYAAKTELFRRVGGWNPDCLGWDDTELGIRMLLNSREIVRLPGEITVDVLHYNDSITGASFTSGAGKWERALDIIRRDFEEHFTADSPSRQRYLRYVNLRCAILAGDYGHENSPELGAALLTATIKAEPSPLYRLLYKAAYHWRTLGLPGVARLLHPLF